MNTKTQWWLVALVVLLFGAALVIQEHSLWSRIANFTVPWFCSALALALLIVLLVSGLRGQKPSELPWLAVIGTVLGVGAVLFAGIEVDDATYPLGRHIEGTRWEMAGFVGILLGLFLVVRRKRT